MINDIATADRKACERRWWCSGVVFIALAFAFLPTIARAGLNTWTSIGPDGGYVSDVAMDPDNSDVLYAATYGGGVFRTQDGGLTWRPRNNGLAQLRINAVAIGSSPTPTLYADTSELTRNGVEFGHFYASTDAGDNWIERSSKIAYRLVVDPTASVIYAWDGNLYRSLDGGRKWSQALLALKDMAVASDGTVYASTSAAVCRQATIKGRPGRLHWLRRMHWGWR